ncbi:hypothetical protein [Pseudochelatococcus sp. G4_1912]|uniref:hypothetical protein n=1 Tax=Pseudochelatococcus sp. G4_1912 TaxID=3114288 RepID=UPI0039C6BB51
MIHALRGSAPLPTTDYTSVPRAPGLSAFVVSTKVETGQTAAKAVSTAFDGERPLPKAALFSGNSAVIGLRTAYADSAAANSLRAYFM